MIPDKAVPVPDAFGPGTVTFSFSLLSCFPTLPPIPGAVPDHCQTEYGWLKNLIYSNFFSELETIIMHDDLLTSSA